MAKKHRESEKIKIQWDGDLASHSKSDHKNQSIPNNIDLGVWGRTGRGWDDDGNYTPNWKRSGCCVGCDEPGTPTWNTFQCQAGIMDEPYYYEDYNILGGGMPDVLSVLDGIRWANTRGANRGDILQTIANLVSDNCTAPWRPGTASWPSHCPDVPVASLSTKPQSSKWTWGDVTFLTTIADGIGTGSRRAREARLNQFEQEKKKRLIRLICRVKGEKVYDEEKEMGDTYIKLEDAELAINEVLGKMRVENANVL